MDLRGTLICKCKFCGHSVNHDYSKFPILGNQGFNENAIPPDPCIPVSPVVKRERMKHVYEPLPRVHLRKPLLPTFPPTAPLQRETTYTHEFYPKYSQKPELVPPNYFHYRPCAPFVGQSTMKTAYQPFIIEEEIDPPGKSFSDSELLYCGEHHAIDTARSECLTTHRFSYYPKKVDRRTDPRIWWQKPAPYATPLTRVTSKTTSRAAFTPPPTGAKSLLASTKLQHR